MNYFLLDLVKVQQFNSSLFYFSTLNFKYLNKTARINSRASTTNSYQREFSKSRLAEIAKYIDESISDEELEIPLFPTPVVLAIELSQDIDNLVHNEEDYEEYIKPYFDVIKTKKISDEDLNIFYTSKDIEDKNRIIKKYTLNTKDSEILENVPLGCLISNNKLLLPITPSSIFIVDGQHRFKGMQKLYNDLIQLRNSDHDNLIEIEDKIKKLENFQFVVSILLDFDIYQQSRIFANINFNQKSVNKSLFYDIFGSIYRERDELTFVHFLVKSLNETDDFKNIVKMLGTGSGTISLAFMVQTILDNLIPKSLEFYKREYIEDSGHTYINLPNFLENYFLFFKDNFQEYFPKFEINNENHDDIIFKSSKYKHFLFKTTGIYGLLNLINDLYIKDTQLFLYDKQNLITFLNDTLDINKIKKLLADEKYLNTAGKGLQKDFYNKLKECIK